MANNRILLKCVCGETFGIAGGLYPWRASATLRLEGGAEAFDAWLVDHTFCATSSAGYDVVWENGMPLVFSLDYEDNGPPR